MFEEDISEEMQDEILKILSQVAEEYMNDPEYYVKASPEPYLLKKRPKLFSDRRDAMEELAESYSWLLPFRFILEANYVLDDDDLLKLINLKKNLKEPCPSKKIIEKLISDQEIRSLLVEKRKECLSKYLLDFCQSYPSLDCLRSLSGRVLSEKMQQSSLDYKEKFLIKELWCRNNSIRKKIHDLSLPLCLADDLEKDNVTDLKQLSQSKITDLSQHFTALEKDKFSKWYQQSFSNTEMRLSEEESHMKELQFNIQHTKSLIKKWLDLSVGDPVLDKAEELEQQLKALHLDCWEGGQEELHKHIVDIEKILTQVEETLSETAYKTDEELIANVGGGSAFHGLVFGMDFDDLCSLAPYRLLKAPSVCDVKKPSISSMTRSFFFQNLLEAIKFKRAVLGTGLNSFYFSFPANIDKKFSGSLTMLNFHIYPMASYSIEQSQMKILPSALESLRDVNNIASAEEFLKTYGSHVSIGVNHFGGILCTSIQVITSQQLTQDRLETIAEEKMKVAYSNILKANQSSVDFDFLGPNIPVPKLFGELLKANNRSWHVIERGNIPAALLPIWTLVSDKHPNLKNEAELLRRAWLRKAAKHLNVDAINKEWTKEDNLQTTDSVDDKRLRDSGKRPIPVATVDNLAEILSEELRRYDESFSQSQVKDFGEA